MRYNIATVIKATYGRDVRSTKEEYALKAEEFGGILAGEDTPGSALIDLVPICEQHFLTDGLNASY